MLFGFLYSAVVGGTSAFALNSSKDLLLLSAFPIRIQLDILLTNSETFTISIACK